MSHSAIRGTRLKLLSILAHPKGTARREVWRRGGVHPGAGAATCTGGSPLELRVEGWITSLAGAPRVQRLSLGNVGGGT